jgi:hypothetical protein
LIVFTSGGSESVSQREVTEEAKTEVVRGAAGVTESVRRMLPLLVHLVLNDSHRYYPIIVTR